MLPLSAQLASDKQEQMFCQLLREQIRDTILEVMFMCGKLSIEERKQLGQEKRIADLVVRCVANKIFVGTGTIIFAATCLRRMEQ